MTSLKRFTQPLRQPSRTYGTSKSDDDAVPFDFSGEAPPENIFKTGGNDYRNKGPAKMDSTITPNEAEIFKSIFDDIAQGRTPKPRHQQTWERAPNLIGTVKSDPSSHARSIVEQARVNDFQSNVLSRFPQDLREAAHLALGLYERKVSSELIEARKETEDEKFERLKYEHVRAEEKIRVDAMMRACKTDFQLWDVMEREVFSLPEKLGIMQKTGTAALKKTRKKRGTPKSKTDEIVEENNADDKKRTMDVLGPLYTHYLSQALNLFDTAFTRPSPFAFQILPRVKSLGLPSYVLGVSTSFYTVLARMHWERFGDAASALDVVQEMNATGLYADDGVRELLATIREHIYGCSLGVQGQFVGAMMEAAPYDASLLGRIEDLESFVEQSLQQVEGDYSV